MARVSMPTQNQRLSFVINDFSGGLVNNVNDVKMKDNQSPDMLNMQFRVDGLIQKRPGTVFLQSTPWGNTLKHVLSYEYEPNKQMYIYVTDWRIMCRYSDFGDEPFIIGEHNGTVPQFTHYMNELFWVDGLHMYSYSHKNRKTYKYVNCPSSFTPKPAPATTGEHKEKFIKYYDNGHVECSALYEKWYEPCQYEMQDGYKGANVIPPCPTLIELKDDRIYISGNTNAPNMVYISDILNPSYFPASLPIQTPPDDDVITALEVYNDCLIIGRRDSIYALTGNTNREDVSQYILYKVNSHTGIANPNCSDMLYSRMFFVGTDGNFYKLNPPSQNSTTMSTSQVNLTLDLTLEPFNLTVSDVRYAHTYFDGTYGLWYVQIGDITLVYNYQLMAWTRYNNINALNFFSMDGELRFCRATGNIYRFASREGNQKYYDEYYDPDLGKTITLPIVAYWTSRNMDMGIPSRVKQFRDTYVTSESFENYNTTVNIKYEIDYVDIQDTFLIENEVSKWDKALFDVNKFVSRNIDRSLPLMLNRRGRTIKVYYGCGYKYWGGLEMFPSPGMIPEYQLVYVNEEDKLYLRVPRRSGFTDTKDKYFMELPESELNQALLVHNIMGIYELKGYR